MCMHFGFDGTNDECTGEKHTTFYGVTFNARYISLDHSFCFSFPSGRSVKYPAVIRLGCIRKGQTVTDLRLRPAGFFREADSTIIASFNEEQNHIVIEQLICRESCTDSTLKSWLQVADGMVLLVVATGIRPLSSWKRRITAGSTRNDILQCIK